MPAIATTAGNLRPNDIGKRIEFDYTSLTAAPAHIAGHLDAMFANAVYVTLFIAHSDRVGPHDELFVDHNYPLTVEEN